MSLPNNLPQLIHTPARWIQTNSKLPSSGPESRVSPWPWDSCLAAFPVRVYERARDFHEIGAGIGFTPNAEWAMKVVDPRIHAAFKRVATPNASDWFQWVDAFNETGTDPRETEE